MISITNRDFELQINEQGRICSLKRSSETRNLLAEARPIGSVTQERPYNNEVKLSTLNKRTTYPVNRVRQEGDHLILGFQTAPYEAVLQVIPEETFIRFRLQGFIVHETDYEALEMTPPPVAEFRLLQLEIRGEKDYAEWMNAVTTEDATVCLMGTGPETKIDSERGRENRILYADALQKVRLEGTEAALIVCEPDQLTERIRSMEEALGLPLGVQSREEKTMNHSIYFTENISPENVDQHIKMAQKGGFRLMQIYYTSLFPEEETFTRIGDYDLKPVYQNGMEDLKQMLQKIKAAGIIPGLHVLHTHIGLKSHYVTPRADHRLHLLRHFTLARPLTPEDTEIYVEQNPRGCEMSERRRILQWEGELLSYEGFTTERPYHFYGVRHGAWNTEIHSYPVGRIGGLLDVSEYCGNSAYMDQDSSLPEEIADRIAEIYNCGFEFLYLDGSEGVQAPFAYHVPNAQYRIWKKLDPKPLFVEGAARSHFSWHYQSAGNAFDIFPPTLVKEKIREFPAREILHMEKDQTCVNFGWWGFWLPQPEDPRIGNGTQADQFEYGTSRAAAWDCPVSVQSNLEKFAAHPRIDDILEVMRRWEQVREERWLTDEQKEKLKDLTKEHHLLLNGKGTFELVECSRIPCADPDVSTWLFERDQTTYMTLWHETGAGMLTLPFNADEAVLLEGPDGPECPMEPTDGGIQIPVGKRRYIRFSLTKEAVLKRLQ